MLPRMRRVAQAVAALPAPWLRSRDRTGNVPGPCRNQPARQSAIRGIRLTPDIFSTRTVESHQQYEAWRQRWRPVLDVSAEYPAGQGFPAENKVWTLHGMAMSRVAAPPVRMLRRGADLRRDSIDHWVLTYCRHGTTEMTTGDATLRAPAGVPFIWSLAEASDSRRSQVERLQLFLTRDAFHDIAPLLDAARGAVLDTPLGHLLGDYLLALERRLPSLTADELPALSRAVGAMVAAAITPSACRIAEARCQIDLGALERVRRHVRRHLHSAGLGPAMVSRQVGISRSQLYRLFEPKGGVARYIQQQRLLAAHAALTDTARPRAVGAIAEELCFADASSFSRAFRRAFGYSPSGLRELAHAGRAPASAPRHERAASADFGDVLRGF
jgi:AraC-like DNA-binding protein